MFTRSKRCVLPKNRKRSAKYRARHAALSSANALFPSDRRSNVGEGGEINNDDTYNNRIHVLHVRGIIFKSVFFFTWRLQSCASMFSDGCNNITYRAIVFHVHTNIWIFVIVIRPFVVGDRCGKSRDRYYTVVTRGWIHRKPSTRLEVGYRSPILSADNLRPPLAYKMNFAYNRRAIVHATTTSS